MFNKIIKKIKKKINLMIIITKKERKWNKIVSIKYFFIIYRMNTYLLLLLLIVKNTIFKKYIIINSIFFFLGKLFFYKYKNKC